MRPIRTATAPLAAVLATATLATPAIARPIDFVPPLSDPATRTSQNLSSPDVQHAPCAPGLAGTTSRPRQNSGSPGARNVAADRGTSNASDVNVIEVPPQVAREMRDVIVHLYGAPSTLEPDTPRAHGDGVIRQLRETTVALYGSRH